MTKYSTLIVDITDSKSLSEEKRYTVQDKLSKITNLINNVYKENIIISLSFTGGDSVQGTFKTIKTAYKVYSLIKDLIFPYEIKAGIGYGKLNEKILKDFSKDDSNKHDGVSYHLAKEAIDFAKKTNKQLIIKTKSETDKILNILINDQDLYSLTKQRQAIYALINIFSPFDKEVYEYTKTNIESIVPIIKEISNYYRNNSKDINILLTFQETLQITFKFFSLNNNFNLYNKDFDLLNDTTIYKQTREILQELTNTSKQNINKIINNANMDLLRKRELAKIESLEIC